MFLVTHKDLGGQFALKLMATDIEPTLAGERRSEKHTRLARFVREGRTLAKLADRHHPGIVRVIDCRRNKAKTRAYLIMEYIDGVSLRQWHNRRCAGEGRSLPSPVPAATTLDIVTQLADALTLVHEHGIIHRDIKPDNIIIRSSLEGGQTSPAPPTTAETVTLVDFGIAKVIPSLNDVDLANGAARSLTTISTREGAILGTVGYMAPEQCRGQPITDRADVYALGVILFEMLSGEPPFKAESAVELLIQHVQHDPPALGEFAAQRGVVVPRWFSALVAAMLDKAPEQRPRMAEVLSTLRTPPVADSCPLPGPVALDSTCANLLVGRSLDAALVAGWVDDAVLANADCKYGEISLPSTRWIVIEGSVGTGKTSFVQAGVVPLLRSRLSRREVGFNLVEPNPGSLAEWLARHGEADDRPTVVCIDQIERLLYGGDGEATRWADLLARILRLSIPVVAITVVRRDALARLRGLSSLRSFEPKVCALVPLTSAMLGEVVTVICRRARIRLGEGLRDRIVRDATASSVPLVFVHLFFQLLWRRRGTISLSLTEYEQLLGSAGLVRFLSEAIEEDLGRLSPAELECARSIVLALVRPGRGLPDSSRVRTEADLLRASGSAETGATTLGHLCGDGSHRLVGPPLLVATVDGGSHSFTLVHDAVLAEVPIVTGWVATDRSNLEYLEHVEELAADWDRTGRPTIGLPQGTLLRHYASQQGLLARMGTQRARLFIAAALTAERRQRAQARWLRVTLLAAVLAIVSSAGVAWWERARAISHARKAAAARDLANERLRQVLEAGEQIATDTDWDLAVWPDPAGSLLDVRRRLLESAETRLRDIGAEELEQPGVRLARIRIRQRLADLAYWHIKLSVAEHWLELASQDINPGLRGAKEREALVLLDALNWSKQGKVAFARGQQDEASRDFERSLSALRQLRVAHNGHSTLSQDDLLLSVATSALELGLARIHRAALPGEDQAGVRLLNEAMATFRQVGALPDAQGLAADVKLHLAEHALRVGHLADAEILLTGAIDQLEALHRASPTRMAWRASLVLARCLLGQLQAAQGKSRTAGATLTEAVDAGRQLLADQPGAWRHRGQLLVVAKAMVELSEYLDQIKSPGGRAVREELCRLISPTAAADGEYARIVSIRNYVCFGERSPVR